MEAETKRASRRPGKKYVGVDLDDAMHDQLNAIAQADQRPLASLIRMILDQYLRVYNSGETLMPTHKIIGQLPMKKDFDHTIADLKNSTHATAKRRREDRDENTQRVSSTTMREKIAIREVSQAAVKILPDDGSHRIPGIVENVLANFLFEPEVETQEEKEK